MKIDIKFGILLTIVSILFQNETQAFLDRDLIIDYFKRKSLSQMIVFSCDDKKDNINLTKFLMNNTFYVSVHNINSFQFNITDILNTNHERFGVVLDADCKNSSRILRRCANKEKFGDKYQWLIFSMNITVFKIFNFVNIHVNAEITVALLDSNKIYWTLLDVYNPSFSRGGTLKIREMGSWSLNNSFNIHRNMSILKYWRRKDMSEVTFKGTIVLINEYPGNLMDYLYNNDTNRFIDTFNRFQFVLWGYVRDFYNFKLDTNLRHAWGSKLKNGSHVGMIGALQRKEVDIGLSAAFYRTERVPVVDFIVPTFIMSPCIIFRYPEPTFAIRDGFFSPLATAVWLSTGAIMFLTTLIIRLCYFYEYKIQQMTNYNNDYIEYDWSYIFLFTFGSLCQQDVPKIPNLYSGRTVIFTSILFTYILYQFYSGGIVSSLLMEPPKTINNLRELIDSSLEIGIEDVLYERDYFKQTSDPLALELYRKKVSGKKNGSDAYYDVNTGLNLVKTGHFAYEVDSNIAYKIIADTYSNEVICDLGEIHLIAKQPVTAICQQDSPFRELFAYGFLRLTEAGIVSRERIKWTTPKPQCIKVVDSSKINVGIIQFFPALLFYLVGIVISFLILYIEIIIYNKTQRNTAFTYCN